jgi:hypothetical protein
MTTTTRLIHGSVLDVSGRPVALARVYFVKAPVAMPDVAALSDAQGRFTLSVPQAGDYEIGASSDTGSASATVVVGERGGQLQIKLPG